MDQHADIKGRDVSADLETIASLAPFKFERTANLALEWANTRWAEQFSGTLNYYDWVWRSEGKDFRASEQYGSARGEAARYLAGAVSELQKMAAKTSVETESYGAWDSHFNSWYKSQWQTAELVADAFRLPGLPDKKEMTAGIIERSISGWARIRLEKRPPLVNYNRKRDAGYNVIGLCEIARLEDRLPEYLTRIEQARVG